MRRASHALEYPPLEGEGGAACAAHAARTRALALPIAQSSNEFPATRAMQSNIASFPELSLYVHARDRTLWSSRACNANLGSAKKRQERFRAMALGMRRSITDLQKDYDNGNKTALETLMRAWKGIKELPPTTPVVLHARRLSTASRSAAPGGTRRPGGAAIASTAPCCSRPGTGPTCTGSKRRCRASRAATT